VFLKVEAQVKAEVGHTESSLNLDLNLSLPFTFEAELGQAESSLNLSLAFTYELL
jgi:hypothetical protein